MQREIKFRGKTLTGNWVFGYYSLLPKLTLPVAMMGEDSYCEEGADYIIEFKTRQHPNFSNAYPLQVCEKEIYEVIPETVGQYTGLKDKNSKEIYEGDIVVMDCYIWFDDGEPNYRGTVEWIYSQWQIVAHCVNPDKNGISDGMNESLNDDGFIEGDNTSWEIIGNIWDNPELVGADNP